MSDNEQIRAAFISGVANVTRSTRVANLVNDKITLSKKYLCLVGIVLWSAIIVYILFW